MKNDFLEVICPECSRQFRIYDEAAIQNFLAGIEVTCDSCVDKFFGKEI